MKIEMKINDKKYIFVKNYKEDKKLRNSLNELTRKTFEFDFERWYQQGYWKERYIPYSLMHEDTIVANVSVNTIDFMINGELKNTIQIGTVMTDEKYRNQGLSRKLFKIILQDYEECSDLIYLFGGDNVLEFYPKFGFVKSDEYQCKKEFKKIELYYKVRKLEMNNKKDEDIFTRLVTKAVPVSKVFMKNNFGLIMFYCSSFMKDNIYYIEDLDIAVVAEYDGNKLHLLDVFSEKDIELDVVINALLSCEKMTAILGFTPLDDKSYSIEVLEKEDRTLFVRGKNNIGRAMFPLLSHA